MVKGMSLEKLKQEGEDKIANLRNPYSKPRTLAKIKENVAARNDRLTRFRLESPMVINELPVLL